MPDQSSDEVHYREGFLHILAIFMAVVMESDKIAVIPVDSWCGNYGASEIAPNVFYNRFRVAFVGLCVHIEPFFVFLWGGLLKYHLPCRWVNSRFSLQQKTPILQKCWFANHILNKGVLADWPWNEELAGNFKKMVFLLYLSFPYFLCMIKRHQRERGWRTSEKNWTFSDHSRKGGYLRDIAKKPINRWNQKRKKLLMNSRERKATKNTCKCKVLYLRSGKFITTLGRYECGLMN